MKRRRLAGWGLAMALIAGAWHGAVAAGYQMKIDFPGYTGRTHTLTNFPVLVVFSNNVAGSGFDFNTVLSEDGYDLRFRDAADTTDLNYEIELWDANNASYVWVQVPEIPADGTGYIWARWGVDNTQLACTTNGATWSEGYLAVWHKGDLTVSTIKDSTANGYDGSKRGADEPVQADGIVGNAQKYDGINDYVDLGASSIYIPSQNSKLTVSAWFYPQAIGSGNYANRAISIYRAAGSSAFILGFDNSNQAFHYDGGTRRQFGGTFSANQWYGMSVVFDGSASQKYQGGNPDGSSYTYSLLSGHSSNAQLGTGAGGSFYNGLMDEVRISDVARSADWIWAEYTTVASNLAFTAYGTAQPTGGDTPFISTLAASGLATTQATLNGWLVSTGTTETAVSVYWGPGQDAGTNVASWAHTNHFGYHTGDLPADYATNITGLVSGETYTYRYYAANDAGEDWGAAASFTTWQAPGVPTIDAPSQTGFVHVVLSGAVNAGVPAPQAWFCLNPGSDGGSGGTSGWARVVAQGAQVGAFGDTIAGLDPETLYYARVYVTNEVDDAWSDPVAFTTLASPAQLTLGSNQQVDGAAPELVFQEALDSPLIGSGTSPANWTFDFAYYGANPIPVVLAEHKLYCGLTGASDIGTLVFDLNGGSIAGDDGVAIETSRGNQRASSHIVVRNVGAMAMGKIDTHAYSSGSNNAYPGGNVTIGTESERAGHVRIDAIDTRTTGVNKGGPGAITIYGTGDVRIEDSNGLRGDLLASCNDGGNRNILVDHAGHFSARHVTTHLLGHWSGGGIKVGNISLNGGNASGDLTAESLDASYRTTNYGSSTRPTITVRNYANVSVGNLWSYSNGTTARAADITITDNITGNIAVAEDIDLWSSTTSYRGTLRLTAGGTVTLQDLNLNRLLSARLSSGSGASIITGAIGDFTTADPTGEGTKADPKVSTETRLRAPVGQIVYYSYKPGLLNDDLGGHVWQLKDLGGTTDGGLLMEQPATGTVIRFR